MLPLQNVSYNERSKVGSHIYLFFFTQLLIDAILLWNPNNDDERGRERSILISLGIHLLLERMVPTNARLILARHYSSSSNKKVVSYFCTVSIAVRIHFPFFSLLTCIEISLQWILRFEIASPPNSEAIFRWVNLVFPHYGNSCSSIVILLCGLDFLARFSFKKFQTSRMGVVLSSRNRWARVLPSSKRID